MPSPSLDLRRRVIDVCRGKGAWQHPSCGAVYHVLPFAAEPVSTGVGGSLDVGQPHDKHGLSYVSRNESCKRKARSRVTRGGRTTGQWPLAAARLGWARGSEKL